MLLQAAMATVTDALANAEMSQCMTLCQHVNDIFTAQR